MAIVGVWKAGGAVVMLDPGLADQRLSALVRASRATLCLATDTALCSGPEAGATRVVECDAP